MPDYFALITTVGAAKLAAAQASENPLRFVDFAVGDGDGAGYTPDAAMTELVNERARVAVNQVVVWSDAENTISIEGTIPAATGGFTVREIGIFDPDGDLIVIASTPPTYKAEIADGVTADLYLKVLIEYAVVEAVELTVDGAVVMATREYVDENGAAQLALYNMGLT